MAGAYAVLCRERAAKRPLVGHAAGSLLADRAAFRWSRSASSLASLQATGGTDASRIALLPAVAVLAFFLESFSVAASRLARDRELAADHAGASVTSAATIATALVKVHAFSGIWAGLTEAAAGALRDGNAFVNASKTFAEATSRAAAPSALEGVAETHLSHPTDSHPPLSARLHSLRTSISNASVAALDVAPVEGAITFVPDAETKEEEISRVYQLLLARRLGIHLDEGSRRADAADVEAS